MRVHAHMQCQCSKNIFLSILPHPLWFSHFYSTSQAREHDISTFIMSPEKGTDPSAGPCGYLKALLPSLSLKLNQVVVHLAPLNHTLYKRIYDLPQIY